MQVAYTFDAGPNACLYMEEEDVPEVAALIQHVFPPAPGAEETFFTGIPVTLPLLSQVTAVIDLFVYLFSNKYRNH